MISKSYLQEVIRWQSIKYPDENVPNWYRKIYFRVLKRNLSIAAMRWLLIIPVVNNDV
jgi:hypothetical protein